MHSQVREGEEDKFLLSEWRLRRTRRHFDVALTSDGEYASHHVPDGSQRDT